MSERSNRGVLRAIVAIALLATVLAGTAYADSLLPERSERGAGEEISRAGFAYLTGIRTFAAAVLWNRIEPVFHGYYEGVPLVEQTYMLPTVHLAITLDPRLQQPYYVAAWMLTQRGNVEEGVELARLGVENNPESGLMRANYAQILWLVAGDIEAAAEQARAGVSDEIEWLNIAEQHDGYVVFRDVFRQAGDDARAEFAESEIVRIDAEMDSLDLDHDHDH